LSAVDLELIFDPSCGDREGLSVHVVDRGGQQEQDADDSNPAKLRVGAKEGV
ncbi:MAG: hypothetical protein RL240_929, partial [Planctomycetota bacterium]